MLLKFETYRCKVKAPVLKKPEGIRAVLIEGLFV